MVRKCTKKGSSKRSSHANSNNSTTTRNAAGAGTSAAAAGTTSTANDQASGADMDAMLADFNQYVETMIETGRRTAHRNNRHDQGNNNSNSNRRGPTLGLGAASRAAAVATSPEYVQLSQSVAEDGSAYPSASGSHRPLTAATSQHEQTTTPSSGSLSQPATMVANGRRAGTVHTVPTTTSTASTSTHPMHRDPAVRASVEREVAAYRQQQQRPRTATPTRQQSGRVSVSSATGGADADGTTNPDLPLTPERIRQDRSAQGVAQQLRELSANDGVLPWDARQYLRDLDASEITGTTPTDVNAARVLSVDTSDVSSPIVEALRRQIEAQEREVEQLRNFKSQRDELFSSLRLAREATNAISASGNFSYDSHSTDALRRDQGDDPSVPNEAGGRAGVSSAAAAATTTAAGGGRAGMMPPSLAELKAIGDEIRRREEERRREKQRQERGLLHYGGGDGEQGEGDDALFLSGTSMGGVPPPVSAASCSVALEHAAAELDALMREQERLEVLEAAEEERLAQAAAAAAAESTSGGGDAEDAAPQQQLEDGGDDNDSDTYSDDFEPEATDE